PSFRAPGVRSAGTDRQYHGDSSRYSAACKL
ncbi:uncharacterized protein METZ01_LOCUS377990, partial [marine metagenome]